MIKNRKFEIFIASSWKQRHKVRELAVQIRQHGFSVYDFTDPSCRKTPEIPPEKFPELFDPDKHNYWEYLNKLEWRQAIEENRHNIDRCNALVLLLPCGIDATADWAYAVGRGKKTFIIGRQQKGERSPVYLWADRWFDNDKDFISFFEKQNFID